MDITVSSRNPEYLVKFWHYNFKYDRNARTLEIIDGERRFLFTGIQLVDIKETGFVLEGDEFAGSGNGLLGPRRTIEIDYRLE